LTKLLYIFYQRKSSKK